MKSIIGAFALVLLIACVAVPNLVHAHRAEGSSATGSFKFVLEDGATRFVEFNAKEGADGQATGDMTFNDPVAIPVDDPDSGETPKTEGVSANPPRKGTRGTQRKTRKGFCYEPCVPFCG